MFFVLLTAHGDQRTEQNSRGETSYHHISYTYICIYDEHANPLSCHFLPFIIIWLLVIKVVYLICPKFQNSIESVEIFTLLKLLVEAYQYHLMWPWALYAMHLWLCTDSPSINIFPFLRLISELCTLSLALTAQILKKCLSKWKIESLIWNRFIIAINLNSLIKMVLCDMTMILCMDLWQVVRELQHSRNGVTVKTEDGCVYEANYVILSASIGVLQSDLISFKPPLPVRLLST